MKSHYPRHIPVGGGAVDTNGWCINMGNDHICCLFLWLTGTIEAVTFGLDSGIIKLMSAKHGKALSTSEQWLDIKMIYSPLVHY